MTIHTDPNAAHAVFAPSSADRWIPCTASAEAIARLPEQEEGEEAAEGTAAHEEIERCIPSDWTGQMCARCKTHDDAFGSCPGCGGTGETHGPVPRFELIDPEHPAAYGIALVLDYVRQLPPGTLWIEQRVALTEQIWGRCDVAHWDAATGILTIVDYKNGMRAVDVEENSQLRIYAAASMFTHNLPVKWIRYVVVQPNDWRPFVPRVKQWHEPVEALYSWAVRVSAIPKGEKSFVAGDHCRDCPLFGPRCSASIDMLVNFGAVIAGLVAPENVRPEQVASFLAMEKPITDQIKKFKKYWETKSLKTGSAPPDMKIVTTRPHRAWIDVDKARAAVIAKAGVDALDPPTPAQAEKLGVDITSLADRPEGGPALAFASDKRPEWKQKTAAEMFAGVPFK